jgi:threonine/homoserine/homoserine lactone efflux protein
MAAISPGPAVLMAARTGLSEGFRTGAALAVGIGVGGVLWVF